MSETGLRDWVPTERQRQVDGGDAAASGVTIDLTDGACLPGSDPNHNTDERRVVESGRLFRRAGTAARELDPRTISGPKLPLAVLVLTGLIGGWGSQTVLLGLPEIQASFGLSIAGLITLTSVFGVLTNALGLPLGYLADRVRRVWLVRINTLGDAIGNILMAVSGGMGQLIGSNALISASETVGTPAAIPLLTDYFPSRFRARIVSLVAVASQVGLLLATLVSGLLIDRYGWRPSLVVVGVVGLLVAAATFLLREPVRGEIDRIELGLSEELAAKAPPPPSFTEALRGAMAIRTVRLLAVAGMVITVANAPVNGLVQLSLANKFLLSASFRSDISVVSAALSIPVLLGVSAVIDRGLTVRPRTIAIGFAVAHAVMAGLLLIEAVAPDVPLFVVPQVIYQILAVGSVPALLTLVSLTVPARYRGLGLQIYTPFALLGTLMSPLVAHFSNSNSPQSLFLWYMPFMIGGSLLYLGTASTLGPDIRRARAAAAAELDMEEAARAAKDKILVVRDLDVAYEDVQVLSNVDLDVHTGEIVALVGTNGAGKSTLLRAICGLTQSANGAVFYAGRDVTSSPAHENAQRGLVYMPGGQGVFPALTVRENLFTALVSLPPKEQVTASVADTALPDSAVALPTSIEEVVALFPALAERLDTTAGLLSGGEQQMVALGQALLMAPRLLMIDELSLGLAPAVVEQLLGVIRQMASSGTTVLLVEQSLNVALTVADRAVFMERGQVQFDGPTDELLDRPDLVRAVFLGGAAAAPSRVRRPSTGSDHPDAPALTAEAITVDFGGMRALDEVSVTVAPGEVVGIIGPNGAGKTTLFDALSGFLSVNAGRVLLGERDVSGLSADARARLGLGRAFQNARLFPPLTVRENIAVALERRSAKSVVLAAAWAPPIRRSERRLAQRVDGFIELLGLGPHADKYVRELSTGTRRAVEVACQMAAEPAVLLLDEPSSGLAQAETESLGPTLLRLVRETGCGMLVIEHDLPLITSVSDRLVAMELGRVLAMGPSTEVVNDPAVLASYLAASNDVIERSGSRVGSVLNAVAGSAGTSDRAAAGGTTLPHKEN